MDKKNILFVAPINPNGRYVGGIAAFSESIVNSEDFLDNGLNIDYVTTCQIKRDAFSSGKFRLQNFLNFFKTKKRISSKLKDNQFDMIYVNTSKCYALLKDLCLLKNKYKRKYEIVIHIHSADVNNIFPKNVFFKKITIKLLKKYARKIIVLSKTMKTEFIRLGFSEKKIFILRNYYSPLLPETDKICNQQNNTDDSVKFLFVGSITQKKGIYDLLKVFSSLDNSYKLYVCGIPNEKNGFNFVKQYSKFENIKFFGFVSGEEKNDIFMNSDVFVLPSYTEGLPISVLEAIHFGLGVIITNVGAIPEIIGKENGILIEPGNLDKLKAAIVYYHNNVNALNLHKKNNLIYSREFSFSTFKDNLIKILMAD